MLQSLELVTLRGCAQRLTAGGLATPEVDPDFWTRGLGGISGLLLLEGSRNHGKASATES